MLLIFFNSFNCSLSVAEMSVVTFLFNFAQSTLRKKTLPAIKAEGYLFFSTLSFPKIGIGFSTFLFREVAKVSLGLIPPPFLISTKFAQTIIFFIFKNVNAKLLTVYLIYKYFLKFSIFWSSGERNYISDIPQTSNK